MRCSISDRLPIMLCVVVGRDVPQSRGDSGTGCGCAGGWSIGAQRQTTFEPSKLTRSTMGLVGRPTVWKREVYIENTGACESVPHHSDCFVPWVGSPLGGRTLDPRPGVGGTARQQLPSHPRVASVLSCGARRLAGVGPGPSALCHVRRTMHSHQGLGTLGQRAIIGVLGWSGAFHSSSWNGVSGLSAR